MPSIRRTAVAGTFYPAEPQALLGALQQHLHGAVPARAASRPKLLVVPHAGYVYSGPVAANAYVQLAPYASAIERVVLLGPAHRVAVHGIAAPTVDAFATPFGAVPLDTAALAALERFPQVVRSDAAHAEEHSLEVQLPFLQAVLGHGFKLVPLVVGHAAPDEVAAVVDALWGGDETLVVLSTDLSHYLADDEARALDLSTAARIAAFAGDLQPREACGAAVLNGALRAARARGLQAQLLDVRTSGDTAGDRQRVVGYASFAIGAPAAETPEADAARLGAALLARARNTIARRLGERVGAEPGHPALALPGATFVTLHDAAGKLRGCIGRLQPETTLDADVRHAAAGAAFRDPRFAPLSAAEWSGLQVEVSLIGDSEPLPAVASADAAAALLRPGVDGVILDSGGRRATFLPQVWEQLPQPRDFLAALQRKAGLPPPWDPATQLRRYAVRKFTAAAAAAEAVP